MKFPLQKARKSTVPRGKCLVCGRKGVHELNTFAFLNGGALKKVGRNGATMSPELEGFLAIGVHGRHEGAKGAPDAFVSIAEQVPLGQFEYYFCGTKCLRKFFNECVDVLEKRQAKNAS